jgi:hypothetical protein
MRQARFAVAAALALFVAACSGSGDTTTGGGGDAASSTSTSTSTSTSSSVSTGAGGGDCASDPLTTGIVAMQTGVSADAFDCDVLSWSAHFGEPDPMLFKAVMYNESRFDEDAIACTNDPCGTPSGWTVDESGCYGLMQVVPACGGPLVQPCIGSNGQPDMEMDPSQADWATSVFNPSVNIEIGIGGLNDNRHQVEQQFPGCTTDQYTLMALGNYANYGSTMGCTQYNTDYVNLVLTTYFQYASAAGYAPHDYPMP